MKKYTLLLGALCLFLTIARAQTNNVGIGTTTPAASALLDVSSTTKGFLAPRMTQTQRDAIATPVATGLLIYQTDNTPGFYSYNGTAWTALSSGGASQLEKITENSKTGHRILGRDPANYGDIGTGAVDLSLSSFPSTTRGATGQSSTAMGSGTTASGENSTAIGNYTTASGNYSTAMGDNSKASGFASTAMGNYTTASGQSSTAMGNAATASGSSSTAMGNGTTASDYHSTAMGNYTTASAENSTAMGGNTTASGFSSTAMGNYTTASGQSSTAMGYYTTAASFTELTLGAYNTSYTPISTNTFNIADRAFGVGIGTFGATKDGLIVYKDGTMYLNKLTAAPTTTTDRIYVLNNKLNYNGAEVGGASQLEKITENSKTGHRILGRDPANYGDIGTDAIDLSLSSYASTTAGATGNSSTAMGNFTTASGQSSTAMGIATTASGNYSTAMGNATIASGPYSIAMGNVTTASAEQSTAMGSYTKASALYSTAMGTSTTASGNHSTAMGNGATASGYTSTAMGYYSTASGYNSTAMGYYSTASGQSSTTMGYYTTASGQSSTTMGNGTTASGSSSTAMGDNITAKSHAEVALGAYNTSYTPISTNTFNIADRAFGVGIGTSSSDRKDGLILYKDGTMYLNKLTAAPTTTTDRIYVLNNKLNYNGAEVGGASQLEKITENSKTGHRILGRDPANYGDIGTDAVDLSLTAFPSTTRGATGQSSTAMGSGTTASGENSTAMGSGTTASGYNSTAMGNFTTASGGQSTAMGGSTTASNFYSTAMGNNTKASGQYSTAMGFSTTASDFYSTAMGYNTKASGQYSTAMGQNTTASDYYSTAMGSNTTASGYTSTAMGGSTTASGSYSTAMGNYTTAPSFTELTLGAYNTSYTPVSTNTFNIADRAFGVGIGTGSSDLKDGLILYKDGTMYLNKLTAAPTTTTDRLYNVSNVLYINGTVVGTQTSDARFKERVENLPSALASIKKLRPVSYYWKDQKWGAQKEIGFIAQELKTQYPEVVVTDTDGYHKVNYGVLTAVLTKGMQEQQSQIEQLEKENAALKAQLLGFADRLGSIEKALNGGTKTITNNAEASIKK
jgi:trimeric autotransporter adhesin